jgi:hypothetical protein
MNYRIVSLNNKWYIQSNTGKYLGGYAHRKWADNLLKKLETQK